MAQTCRSITKLGITKQMISAHIVKLATEYLDQCALANKEATLVGMHWHIDSGDKTIPLLAELNQALEQRPSIFVRRESGEVIFSSTGTERTLTQEDMKLAFKRYEKEFAAALRKLEK